MCMCMRICYMSIVICVLLYEYVLYEYRYNNKLNKIFFVSKWTQLYVMYIKN